MEKKLINRHKNLVAIDEAGRGALAGPLMVGSLYLDKTSLKILEKNKVFFLDSKILNPQQREVFRKIIQKIGLEYKIISISNKRIDKIGINKAFIHEIKKIYEYFKPNCVVLDGKPIREFYGSNTDKTDNRNQYNKNPRQSASDPYKSVFYFFIKGDQKLCSLGGASILAKTRRDSYMKKISKKFPEYLFDIHKGYGTKKHYLMIKKYGPCPLHRRTFLNL